MVDSGRVAMSNPLRQSLYTLDDCLNGGEFKATAAAKNLKKIFPAVVSGANSYGPVDVAYKKNCSSHTLGNNQ